MLQDMREGKLYPETNENKITIDLEGSMCYRI